MKKLIIFAVFVFLSMLIVTTWASLQENVLVGGAKVIQQPWGIATLFDTYFAFFTFYLWVIYKEKNILPKIIWLFLIILLGNFAMSAYLLLKINEVKDNFSFEKLLCFKK